jgi:hypothetical protein
MPTNRRLPRILPAALIAMAVAVPSAHARPKYDRPADPSPVAGRGGDESFDLGSAAIGAGSASAFLLLTAGVAVLGQRRYRISVVR